MTQNKQSTPSSIVIVGGGFSGLATAYYLGQQGLRVTLIEKRHRLGGWVDTTREDGFMAEAAANGFLAASTAPTSSDAIVRMAHGMDFADAIIPTNPAFKKRYIYYKGALHAVPMSPPGLIRSKLLSAGGKLRIFCEPFIGKGTGDDRESLSHFVARRFGAQVADNLIDPMMKGIYAGNARRLSARWAMPAMTQLEENYGSVIKGAIKGRKTSAGPKKLYTFKEGMASFVQRCREVLEEKCNTTILCGTEVARLETAPQGFRLTLDRQGKREVMTFGKVVVATSAPVAAKLLQEMSPDLGHTLREQPVAPIMSATLGFKSDAFARPLDGYGFLVRSGEPLRLLGAIWSSAIFPQRAPDGHATLTCMLGGDDDHEVMEWNDDRVLEQICTDLTKSMELRGEPVYVKLHRYLRAIPQYDLQHGARIQAMEEAVANIANLHLAGNYFDGVALGRLVERGEALAKQICEQSSHAERSPKWNNSSSSVQAQPA